MVVMHVARDYRDVYRWRTTYREFATKRHNHTALRTELDAVREPAHMNEDLRSAVIRNVVKAVRYRRWRAKPFREPPTRDVFWLPFLIL